MESFEALLTTSRSAHGHICPGQVVGIRMAMLGCRLIGLEEPTRDDQIKKLVVYVEMDRCTADAVAHVTGVKLGRRSLKFMDYGIMAATFLNLETGRAYRIISTEESRDLAPWYAPEISGKAHQQLEAYKRMPESVLFRVQQVTLEISEFDLPGPTRSKLSCSRCGQVVRDRREEIVDGEVLCKPCAHGAYFKEAREIPWAEVKQIRVEACRPRFPVARNGLPFPSKESGCLPLADTAAMPVRVEQSRQRGIGRRTTARDSAFDWPIQAEAEHSRDH